MRHHKVVTDAVHQVQVPLYPPPPPPQGVGGGTNNNTPHSVSPKICLQILHSGRYAYHPWAVSASATRSPISPFGARALSKKEIQQTVVDFTHTAVLAKEVGYDGVEIMGSEGYLLSQFLSPSTNLRTDDYGGTTFANRSRFPLEIVQSVREATGPEFLIIFRISLLDLVQEGGGMTWEETLELAVALEKAGVSILNTGIGWHEVCTFRRRRR
jgi:2,4-dienoyl-CoA reductase (NADPH2)